MTEFVTLAEWEVYRAYLNEAINEGRFDQEKHIEFNFSLTDGRASKLIILKPYQKEPIRWEDNLGYAVNAPKFEMIFRNSEAEEIESANSLSVK